jgi:transposase-like protein
MDSELERWKDRGQWFDYLYSRGLSDRDIEAHLQEMYGVKVGRELISKVTDAVMDDVRSWQQRPLEDVYPVVFLDALVLKIRDGGSVQRKACYPTSTSSWGLIRTSSRA